MTRHVDKFIWDHSAPPDANSYARWMLMHFRLPAVQQMDFAEFIKDRRLFCDYEGKRYRCTGASRMGDVWLATDFDRVMGYDERVDVDACSNWGAEP